MKSFLSGKQPYGVNFDRNFEIIEFYLTLLRRRSPIKNKYYSFCMSDFDALNTEFLWNGNSMRVMLKGQMRLANCKLKILFEMMLIKNFTAERNANWFYFNFEAMVCLHLSGTVISTNFHLKLFFCFDSVHLLWIPFRIIINFVPKMPA